MPPLHSKHLSKRHRIVVSLAALLGCATVASSQPFNLAQGQREMGSGSSADAKQGVYVRDSAVAGEKLALAQRMERLKEWDKSADVYQEIVEKYSDRVLLVPNTENGAQRYSSVTLTVHEHLGKWPDEGLTRYRARYESPAATMLESAGVDDAAALTRVVQLYFPTDAAKNAALRLIELNIENGEFAAAAWLGQRLLDFHPGIEVDRAKVLFRTSLADHLGGSDDAARAKLDELKNKYAGATGTFAGRDVVLADELAKLLDAPALASHGSSPDTWPIFGGDATRGRVPQSAGRPGARLVEIPFPLPPKRRPNADREQRGANDAADRARRMNGDLLGVMPVVDRGELFYQFQDPDGAHIYAKGLESGLTLPGWSTTYGGQQRAVYSAPNRMVPFSNQLTVTVTDSVVLAVLGQGGPVQNFNELGIPMRAGGDSRLECVDRATGTRKWSASPRSLPETPTNLRQLELGGSPLVVGENVYVPARAGNATQFEDAYILCYSLADGRFRWACYLASGNAVGDNVGMAMQSPFPHLAYSGGRIYAVTNLGAVAAVDAYAGTIVWLSLYPRPPVNLNATMMPDVNGIIAMRKPWAINPTVVKDGKVFCLPTDAKHALVYDAGTGAEIKRIPITDFDNADTLLGVIGDKLLLNSRKTVYCVNWPKYDPQARQSDNMFWNAPLSGSGTEETNRDTIRGRGFVTTDSVFIATKWNLRRLDLSNGKFVEKYPHDDTWAPGEGPGNVVVTSDQVIIAGADGINVYSDLSMARAKLDRAESAAPADPLPRLKYAETLFAAGEIDPAVNKLDQAIQLLGGAGAMRPGPARDRVFARAVAFAERSADPKIGASDPARAAALYDRAAGAASSPQQQVTWRLSRARFAHTQHDFPAEVRLLQEILSDASYRAVLVPADDGPGTTPAGAIAEAGVAERMKDTPAAYAPFEQAAAGALETAKKKHDPAAMLAVAQQYPNAKSALASMLAAADAFEAAGKYRNASQILGQAYRKYHDAADRPLILEGQARNSLMLPNGVGVAIGRLNEGAKINGAPQLQRPLKLPDGDVIEHVTFAAASEMLQRYSARVAQAGLPEFNIPLSRDAARTETFAKETRDTVISNVDQLVLPPRELRDHARYDRVVTWSAAKGLNVYAIGANTPLGSAPTMKQPPLGGVWVGTDLLLWTADTITLLKGDALALGWTLAVKSLPSVDVVEGADSVVRTDDDVPNLNDNGVVAAPGVIIIDNQVINVRRGRFNLRNGGQVVMQARKPGEGGEKIDFVRPVGDRAIVATSTGRIGAIDLSNGQLAWQTRVGEAPIDQLLASDDFVAARFVDDSGPQIVALDTFAGQIVMRCPFKNDAFAPLNMAFSPDGTLVYTLPDRVCGKDLYEPGKTLKFGDKALVDGNRFFDGAIWPDQLVVADGRILALSDQGQLIRVISLETGREVSNPLSTSAPPNNWNVWMSVVGPRVYVFNSRTLNSYNLNRSENSYPYAPPRGNVRDAFIGKRHLVLLTQPFDQNLPPSPPGQIGQTAGVQFQMLAYARYVPPAPPKTEDAEHTDGNKNAEQTESDGGSESRKLEQDPWVNDRVGIDRWQPVEGGFYYRSVDGKAHFLKGTGKPLPTTAPATAPAP